LSGGATFGYYHLGVVKALFDRRLLPSVITGTSAGGLIAALICSRTDEELAQVLNPKLSSRITIAYEATWRWILRYYRTGARFDSVDWFIKGSWFTRGSLTFLEAYERTGRILNISVIPHDPHSPPKLLNYLTAPHCVITTAIIASAAVPGVSNGKDDADGIVILYTTWINQFVTTFTFSDSQSSGVDAKTSRNR
jgi:predicted acylesterase/phospholipase RssA